MARRIVADPEGGFPGKIDEDGKKVDGFSKLVAYVYGEREVVPAGTDSTTIGALRALYWDASRQALVIPRHSDRTLGTFEFGAKLLRQTTDTTVVHLQREFLIPGRFDRPKGIRP